MEKECKDCEMTCGYRGKPGTCGTPYIYMTNWLELSKKFDEYINLKYGNAPVMDTGSDFDVYMAVLDGLCKDEQFNKNWSLSNALKRLCSKIKYRRFKRLAKPLLLKKRKELTQKLYDTDDPDLCGELRIKVYGINELIAQLLLL